MVLQKGIRNNLPLLLNNLLEVVKRISHIEHKNLPSMLNSTCCKSIKQHALSSKNVVIFAKL